MDEGQKDTTFNRVQEQAIATRKNLDTDEFFGSLTNSMTALLRFVFLFLV